MKTILTFLSAALLCTGSFAQSLSGKLIFSLPGSSPATDSICTINPDGSGFTFITNGSYPRRSPDGTKLAYLYGTQTVRTLNDIYFRNSSGNIVQFYDNGSTQHILNYDFTASSAHFLFDWQNEFYNMQSGNPNGQSNNNGSGAGDLTDEYPRVSPVDSALVAHNSNNGLYLVTYGGGSSSHIPNTQPGDMSPCWSPDGQWIYFARQYSTGAYSYKMHNIYRIKRDGTNLSQITNLPATDTLGMSLVVTGNGSWVVTTARIGGVTGIYKFKIIPGTPATTGYAVKTFPYLGSTQNFWLGNADSVTNSTAIPEIRKNVGAVYPNPITGNTVTLQAEIPVSNLALYDAAGHLVQAYAAIPAGRQQLALPQLAAGIYYLRGTANNEPFMKQLLITAPW